MTPEQLLVMATQSGLDLALIAKAAPPRKARPRYSPVLSLRMQKMLGAMPRELRPKGIPARVFHTAEGKPSRPSWAAEWLPTDFALACGQMPRLPWHALAYTAFEDPEDRSALWGALVTRANRIARREDWPAKMRRGNCACGRASSSGYLQDLASLALLEWRHPHDFRTQEQLARWFGVRQPYWSQVIAKRYQPMRDALEIWFGAALGHIWRSLHGEREAA